MRDAGDIDTAIGARCRTDLGDRAIAELAASQHGVVARTQLLAAGFGRRAIQHRLDAARLHSVHLGVYAVGHRVLSRKGAWMAAVLAGGRGAVLSYRSAAALWAIRDTGQTRVEITVPRAIRGRPGLHVHKVTLPEDEITHVDGIPVTTLPRTLLDLAAVVPPYQLERAVNEAEVRRLSDPLSLDAVVARYPRRHGVPAIRRLLEQRRIGLSRTRSELEARFLSLVDAYGLPRPRTNATIVLPDGRTDEPDCLWREHRLVVELDSRGIHNTPAAFERDRARDRELQTLGYRVVRITWRQLHDEPHMIAKQLEMLLGDVAPAAPRAR